MNLTEGSLIAGKYRLDRRLGRGGMGEVWAATQTVTRKPVALKFIHASDEGEGARRRFLREARAACAVRHPNVVGIHDVLELEDGAPVMVMELLVGESLEQRLRGEGRLPLGELAGIMLRVVAAVGTAHAAGVVHRDLKPDNIFLAETPEGVEVKVLDFGIAKLTALEGDAAETAGLTNTGAMLGTPHYMSPEQAFGERQLDHRADIWSLGIILYRGLSGVLPTQAENLGQILKIIMRGGIPKLAEVAPDLPADLVAIVDKMLEADPNARPGDLREVKAVLERHAGVVVDGFSAPGAVLGDTPPDRRSGTPPVRSRTGASRGKLVPIALSAVALAALVAGALVLTSQGKPRDGAIALDAPTVTAVGTAPEVPSSSAAPAAAVVVPVVPSVMASAALSAAASSVPRPGRPPASVPAAVASSARAATSALVATSAPLPEPPKTAKPSLGGVIENPNF